MITTETPCKQVGCQNKAAYRFTWPGYDEAGICERHAEWAGDIAEAMGFHLELIPVTHPNETSEQ
jgi:hypothetical protein